MKHNYHETATFCAHFVMQFPLAHFVNVDEVGVDKIGINPDPAENIITYHLQWVEME